MRAPLEAESARWGDARGQALRDPIDDWEPVVQGVRDSYLPARMTSLLADYAGAGLLAPVDAPTASPPGGALSPGDPVALSGPAGTTVYYTTDGSDPKTALDYSTATALALSSASKVTGAPASTDPAVWGAPGFDDSDWTDDDGDIDENIPVNSTRYIRLPFNIASQAELDALHGLAAYLIVNNGDTELYLNGQSIGTASYQNRYSNLVIPFELSGLAPVLQVGQNVLGVKFSTITGGGDGGRLRATQLALFSHNAGSNAPAGTLYSAPVPAPAGLSVLKARARDAAGQWSALTEAEFDTGLVPADLVVSEFNYRPHNPALPAETAVSTDRDDFEYIELMNIGAAPLALDDYFFSDGVNFSFPPGSSIPAGGRALIVRDLAAFTARYGSPPPAPILGEYTGRLSNDGERVAINTPSGPVVEFTYNDKAPWPESADGDGPSLVLVDPLSDPDHNDPPPTGASAASPAAPRAPTTRPSSRPGWRPTASPTCSTTLRATVCTTSASSPPAATPTRTTPTACRSSTPSPTRSAVTSASTSASISRPSTRSRRRSSVRSISSTGIQRTSSMSARSSPRRRHRHREFPVHRPRNRPPEILPHHQDATVGLHRWAAWLEGRRSRRVHGSARRGLP